MKNLIKSVFLLVKLNQREAFPNKQFYLEDNVSNFFNIIMIVLLISKKKIQKINDNMPIKIVSNIRLM